jgi:hypothetical protein
MAYKVVKQNDGDLSLGNLRGELVNLQPAVSDYQPGGYLIEGVSGTTENAGNIGLGKVLFVIPVGGQGDLNPVWNPATSKLQIFIDSAMVEAPPTSNFASYSFALLVGGTG